VTASSDTISFCPNSSALLTVSGAANYSWSPLAGATLATANTIQFNPATSQTYWITGISGVGCKDSIPVYVDARGLPTIDAGLSDSICPGSPKQLHATGVSPANYVWTSNPATTITSPNSASPTVSPSTTTMFYVQGTDTYGCVGRDSVQLFMRSLPTVNGGSDTMLCVGSSIVIGAATGAVSYSWQGANVMSGGTTASPTVAPLSTANYIVTGTDIHQCTNKDTVLVTVNALPLANAGANVSICTSSTQLNATGGIDYSWSPSINLNSDTISNPIASVLTTSTYTVTVRDANGCVNTDAVTITVYPVLATTISSSTTICANNQTILSAIGSGGDGGPYSYSWSPATGIIGSASQQSITTSPSVTTIYTVTVTDQCGSVPVTATVQVSVNPLPVISFSSNLTSGCTPICVNFIGNSIPAAVSCSYDFGDGNMASGCNPSHCYTTAGNYSVIYTVTDGNGCQNTLTNTNMIQAYPVPQAGITVTPPVTSILLPIVNVSSSTCVGCDTIRYVFGGLPGDSTVNNPSAAFDFIYSQPGTYSVTQYVTNQYGCEDSTNETIIVEPDFTFYAPNAFTPDNDGINDVFLVRGDGLDESSFELQIFNRWGKAIYGSSDMNKGWDGQANGTVAANEVYIWRVTIRDNRGKPHDFVGHVTLIR
jgi:gliding motility-associated-like protein